MMNINDLNIIISSLYIGKIKTSAYLEAERYIHQVHSTHLFPHSKVGFLVGYSGLGKSLITDNYAAKFPDIEHSTYTEKRIIYIELASKCSLGDLYRAIYQKISHEKLPKTTNVEAFDNIVLLCKRTRVQMIIIDEAQHILPEHQNSVATVIALADAIKTLRDKTGAAILLTGMPSLVNLLTLQGKSKEKSKQLQRRSFAPHRFARLTIEESLEVLKLIKQKLACSKVIADVNNKAMLMRFYIASEGTIGSIIDLFHYGLVEGEGKITLETLADAFDLLDAEGRINPFKLKCSQLEVLYSETKVNIEREYQESEVSRVK
jgi:DNA transposition AAA+ family ATPase